MRQYINWKTYLILVALVIVTATLYYTNQLARNLSLEEKNRAELLIKALRALNTASEADVSFALEVVTNNTTTPLIITDDKGNISQFINIDTSGIKNGDALLKDKLEEFGDEHPPLISSFGSGENHIYYGDSYLLRQLRLFPYVQLTIIILFLVVVLIALSIAHRSIQNQVWVGLSKETAHQLGTPLSSLVGWIELLKEHEQNKEAVAEMEKDVDRLKLVADRFGKVGSVPKLEEENLVVRLSNMVDYMQKRAPSKIEIALFSKEDDIRVNMSGPLFDWVIENLIRNALDAMHEKGSISIYVSNHPHQVWIDVKDSGKGIPAHQVKKIFNPGFTTKKRGWGLGLSLSRRIIEKYHHGSIFVKHSEPGKGTTFRIILRR
ncbi:MAG TPA: HAMP domain-containing sensor histidine kinase [Flavipsychrobacter sp.]|nr:HAMP domain-containing sensor histidine kinase [Flavipsychrobacter sp.]